MITIRLTDLSDPQLEMVFYGHLNDEGCVFLSQENLNADFKVIVDGFYPGPIEQWINVMQERVGEFLVGQGILTVDEYGQQTQVKKLSALGVA